VRGADAATGAHRHAVHADTDLSLRGIARLVSELIDRLDLGDVTVVGNDTGGALVQLLDCDGAPTSAGSSSPPATRSTTSPGLIGKSLVLTGKLPPAMVGLFMQHMRLRPVRRLPIAFGWLARAERYDVHFVDSVTWTTTRAPS
jgi:pimeloyl-ACP methyl ester carboxylesterase